MNFRYLINTAIIEARNFSLKSYWNFLKQALSTYLRPLKNNYQYTVLQIESTLNCNLNCIFCSHEINNPAYNLSSISFDEILKQFPYLHQINLTGIGESFMNPQIFEIIRSAKNKAIYLRIVNNGTMLSDKIDRQLIENGVDEVRVSIDAVEEGLFRRLRGDASISRIADNIRRLAEIKKELRSSIPAISFNTVLSMTNYREITKIVHLAISLGVRAIYSSNLINKSNDSDIDKILLFNNLSERHMILDEFNRALSLAKRNNIYLRLPAWGREESVCRLPWIYPYLTFEGDVLPCCFAIYFRGGPNYFKFGNIFKDGFNKIINSQPAIDFRRDLKNKKYPDICKNCLVKNGFF